MGFHYDICLCDNGLQISNAALIPQYIAGAAGLQPKMWRIMAPWNYVAKAKDPGTPVTATPPTTSHRDWSTIDRCINDILLMGTDILMIIGQGRPTWYSNTGNGFTNFLANLTNFFSGGHALAVTAADYGNFAAEVAARYKPGGVGIRTDGIYAPNAGKGVTNFEIWNEENSPLWVSNISAKLYVAYLKAAYAGIKSVLPGAQSNVVFGGLQHVERQDPYLVYGWLNEDELTFLSQCYKVSGTGANALGNFYDTMAEHFYPQSDTLAYAKVGSTKGPAATNTIDNYLQLVALHNLMVTNGDGAKKIWITEAGYQTASMTEADQATNIAQMLTLLDGLSYVTKVFIYNLRDPGGGTVFDSQTWGVMRSDFTPKPAYSYLQSIIPYAGTGTLNLPLFMTGVGSNVPPQFGSQNVAVTVSGQGGTNTPAAGQLAVTVTPSGIGAEKYVAAGTMTLANLFAGSGVLPNAAGTLDVSVAMTGTGSDHEVAAGTLNIGVTVSGTGGVSTPVAGTLSLPVDLSGVASNNPAGVGSLNVALTYSGSGTQYLGTGTLTLTVVPTGTAAEVVAAAGSQSVSVAMTGTGSDNESASGTLTLPVTMTGTGAEKYTAAGTLSIAVSMTGTGAGPVATVGTQSVAVTMSATLKFADSLTFSGSTKPTYLSDHGTIVNPSVVATGTLVEGNAPTTTGTYYELVDWGEDCITQLLNSHVTVGNKTSGVNRGVGPGVITDAFDFAVFGITGGAAGSGTGYSTRLYYWTPAGGVAYTGVSNSATASSGTDLELDVSYNGTNWVYTYKKNGTTLCTWTDTTTGLTPGKRPCGVLQRTYSGSQFTSPGITQFAFADN